jgi:hypothetical protein
MPVKPIGKITLHGSYLWGVLFKVYGRKQETVEWYIFVFYSSLQSLTNWFELRTLQI